MSGRPILTCLALATLNLIAGERVEELHTAARAGNLKRVQELIASGIPVDARDSLGGTPLHYAAWAGELKVAEYLISAGADVNARHTNQATPLHYATMANRVELVELLLADGADPNSNYNSGETSLHMAAAGGFGRIKVAAAGSREARSARSKPEWSRPCWMKPRAGGKPEWRNC